MGPSLSMLHVSVMHPCRLTRPNVGRRPVTPHRMHGDTMLPHVSLPMANPASPAATADALPADDPLDPCFTFHGLRVMPPNHWSPSASAPSVTFAASTAPALSSRPATVAFPGRVWSLNWPAPQVVL